MTCLPLERYSDEEILADLQGLLQCAGNDPLGPSTIAVPESVSVDELCALMDEARRRGLRFGIPQGFERYSLPGATPYRFLPKGQIIRYGRRDHIERMIKAGIVSLSRSSAAKSWSSMAQQDDEERRPFHYPDTVTIRGHAYRIQHGTGAFVIEPPYYFVSTSLEASVKMFEQFPVDACVVIRNRSMFANAIWRAAEARFHGGGCHLLEGEVTYYSPRHGVPRNKNRRMLKLARYSWQREHRVVVAPFREVKDARLELRVGWPPGLWGPIMGLDELVASLVSG